MGVEIRTERRPIRTKKFEVELVSLKKLIPHEMTIQYALEAFKLAVQVDGMVNHPIIVDKTTNLILDGHHRHSGLSALGFSKGPAIFIDYNDDNIVSLDTWYPKVRHPTQKIISEFEKEDLIVDECSNDFIDYSKIANRAATAIIGNKTGHWTVRGERELIFKIIRDNWLDDTIYYDNAKHCINDANERETAIISWTYSKKEILEGVKSHKIYLPKTTRHTMHYLVENCDYPLSKLPVK